MAENDGGTQPVGEIDGLMGDQARLLDPGLTDQRGDHEHSGERLTAYPAGRLVGHDVVEHVQRGRHVTEAKQAPGRLDVE
ncbi:hypothetical protein [Micromonospora sp. DT227]|uniref:hypothetical protein n=1 Tax=Micromonospora sp. DT227 TaxID=3393433 RepID=UPI003CEE63E0